MCGGVWGFKSLEEWRVGSGVLAHQNRGGQAPSGASEGDEGQALRIAAPERRGLGQRPSIIGAWCAVRYSAVHHRVPFRGCAAAKGHFIHQKGHYRGCTAVKSHFVHQKGLFCGCSALAEPSRPRHLVILSEGDPEVFAAGEGELQSGLDAGGAGVQPEILPGVIHLAKSAAGNLEGATVRAHPH